MFILSNLHCATFALCEILLLLLPAIIWVKCGRHDIISLIMRLQYYLRLAIRWCLCKGFGAIPTHTHT
jgi:hypothetical protein